ncbi:MAG: hypothetical protein JNK85_04705 [Verrucomicrobiales bacterium]|nr:hypothetical protein [Verrucomicrobiales bacterium]
MFLALVWAAPYEFPAISAEPPPSFLRRLRASIAVAQPEQTPALDLALEENLQPARWNPGDRWTLPVGPTRDAVLCVADVRFLAGGGVAVRGHLEGHPASVVHWVFVGDRAAGVAKSWPGTDCVYLPGMAGRATLRGVSSIGAPRCGNEDHPPSRRLAPMAAPSTVEPRGALATNMVDLGFFYTPKAEEAAGGPTGMRALLELALLEANDAFERSGARVRLQAVCHQLIQYTESGTLAVDLDRFGRTGDGWMDEVHAFRDLHGADLCCLVTEFENSNQYAGMANQLYDTTVSSLSRGFTACLRPYLIGNYTLPHEIGHLMGCNHDRENAGSQGLDAWSYGTRITVDGEVYRTVMAYRPGLQFPHFSNPRVNFRGVPTGFANGAGIADNVRTLNSTAGMIANVRRPAARVGFAEGRIEASESAGAVRLAWLRTGSAGPTQVTVRTRAESAQESIDFQPVNQRIAVSQPTADGVIEVPLINNAVADGVRRFVVELVDPAAGLTLGPIPVVSVTITDDETDPATLLDTGFQTRPGADYLATAVAATPDGAVLAGGGFATFNGESHPRLVRIRPDGSADSGFQAEVKYRVNAIAPLDDGRIVIGGEFNTVNGVRCNHLAVLKSDGTPDPTFDFENGPDLPVEAIAVLPDGSFYIGGAFTNVLGRPVQGLARITKTGAFDAGFESTAGPDGPIKTVAVDVLGRVTLGGAFRRFGGFVRGGIVRLKDNGVIDDAFGGGQGADGNVQAVATDAQGRPWVGGDFKVFHGEPAGGLVRLNDNGQRDPNFRFGAGADAAVTAVAFARDGKVWIAGRFTEIDGSRRRHVARLHPDGSLDTTFDPGSGPDNWVLALSPRVDGGVVIGGLFSSVNGARRGAVAAYLGALPEAPRFVSATASAGRLDWTADVAPGQAYGVEASDMISPWLTVETFRATGTRVTRTWQLPGAPAAFLRLRRVLE